MKAREAFAKAGKNPMTPKVLEYGWVTDQVAYELSEGTGFDHELIIGVTFRTRDGGTVKEPESKLVWSLEEAREYLNEVTLADLT